MDISDWLILAAVIVALGIGVSSLIQTQRLQRRERKEILLNEIIEWATDIQKVSLEIDIPLVTDGSLDKKKIQASILLRYGIPFIRNDYIKAIVSKEFKDQLLKDVEDMIKNFTAFLFCSMKSFGVKDEDIESSFNGTALKIIEEVKERLKKEELSKLLEEYTNEKSEYANKVLIKVGNIKASP